MLKQRNVKCYCAACFQHHLFFLHDIETAYQDLTVGLSDTIVYAVAHFTVPDM